MGRLGQYATICLVVDTVAILVFVVVLRFAGRRTKEGHRQAISIGAMIGVVIFLEGCMLLVYLGIRILTSNAVE